MSLLQLYRDLKTDIKALEGINTVVKYNSQLDNLKDEEAISYPAVFLSFSSQWEDRATGCQSGEITIRFRTVIETYLDDDEGGFLLANKLHELLQGYVKDYFEDGGAMRRIEQGLDENHDQLEEDEIVYICTIIDDTADNRKDYQDTGAPITLEIEKDIDKDNNIINTGDGDFTKELFSFTSFTFGNPVANRLNWTTENEENSPGLSYFKLYNVTTDSEAGLTFFKDPSGVYDSGPLLSFFSPSEWQVIAYDISDQEIKRNTADGVPNVSI